ncbi:MAG TPA: UbiA-like polyprenyltransferase [Phycisphaerae bacterium]|nr:UbiA-like polyprenyltransferase [Phycisphaerae bacterium]HRY67335.1 UbiA-like polyprenyltransferase [Phycisphaerae bacterium]HSA28478.1 UbiA-like polyprenyltransferase [Phycisphaerae bacterium]
MAGTSRSTHGLLGAVVRWGEMVKFSHSVFALPFALMATFLAGRAAYLAGQACHVYPSPGQIILIVACMVAARSVAMTFNRIVDAELDARNPRTQGRAIPAGVFSKRQAAGFGFAAVAVFELSCAGFLWLDGNSWPLACSLPVLGYLCFYSYTKRFTRLSHFVLGSAIALSPVGAWVAIHPGSVGWPALVLMATVTFWIGGFDIIYACQDVAADRAEGLYSLPSRLGVVPALWIVRAAHLATVGLLVLLGDLSGLGWLYFAGVGMVAVLLAVENALVRPGDLSRVNLAFFTVNGVVSVLLGLLTVADVLMDPSRR